MSFSPPPLPAEDIISSLPDSVLSHILSFLPTKFAVTTSVLSKRWTTLWLSVPTLDVDEESFESFESFRLFVYSVTVSPHPKLTIKSLRIRCGKSRNFDLCDLNQLVLVAVQRGLQNFDLQLNKRRCKIDEKLVPTIFRVFSCKTLVVLKLKNLCVYDFPSNVHLPLLKTLHLEDIFFLNECVHLMNLLNGCPILEDLHIDCLYHLDHECYVSKKKFKGFPSLVRANIRRSEPTFPFVWLYNAEFMCVAIDGVEQMLINKYPVPTFHNLTHMKLILHYDWFEMWVIHVLRHCPKLQNLIFVQVTNVGGIEVEDWKGPETETVPECLSSQLRTCSLIGFKGNQCELHFTEYIMLNSKILRTMTIQSNLFDEKAKYQILKKLSSYSRGSVTCKLFFD